jgi:hypothetical protein
MITISGTLSFKLRHLTDSVDVEVVRESFINHHISTYIKNQFVLVRLIGARSGLIQSIRPDELFISASLTTTNRENSRDNHHPTISLR